MDEAHIYRGIRYVEKNPVRAKLVRRPWDYKWSSARQHMGMDNEGAIGLCKKYRLIDAADSTNWRTYLEKEDEAMNKEVRLKTSRGLVIGGEGFIKKLEKKLGRSLKCLPWGRPKKNQ